MQQSMFGSNDSNKSRNHNEECLMLLNKSFSYLVEELWINIRRNIGLHSFLLYKRFNVTILYMFFDVSGLLTKRSSGGNFNVRHVFKDPSSIETLPVPICDTNGTAQYEPNMNYNITSLLRGAGYLIIIAVITLTLGYFSSKK